MRPFFIAWAFSASIASQLCAQSWTQQAIPMAERSHDFGTVARAAATDHRFQIHNNHKEKMHIRGVRTSCGCTTPIVETEWIEPGQTGTILARFNTATHTGQRGATVTVTIDQPIFTEIQLNVKGYIRSDVVFNPGEINFGPIPQGQAKQMEVIVDYAGRNDWSITKVSSQDDLISVDHQEVSRGEGRVRYRLLVSLADTADPGFLQNNLILHTNDRRLSTVPVRYFAEIQAPLSATPRSLALGDLKPGEAIQKRVVIKGGKPFKVLDVTSQDLEIQFEPTPQAKPLQFLNVTMAPLLDLSKEGDLKSSLRVVTDLEGEKSVDLDVNYRLQKSSKTVSTNPSVRE